MVQPVFNILNIPIIFTFSKNLYMAYNKHLSSIFPGLHKKTQGSQFSWYKSWYTFLYLSHFLYHFIYFIYMDDIFIIGSSSAIINHLIHKLNSSFAFKHWKILSLIQVFFWVFIPTVYCWHNIDILLIFLNKVLWIKSSLA